MNNKKIIRFQYYIMTLILFTCIIPFNWNDRRKDDLVDNNNTNQNISVTESSIEIKSEPERPDDSANDSADNMQKDNYSEEIKREANDLLDYMTIEEKVAQLFIVYPESLVEGVSCVTLAGEATKKSIEEIPVGGVLYMSQNLENADQVKEMLANIQSYSLNRISVPLFLCVDEEGGRIARIANNGNFSQENVGDMADVGSSGNPNLAYSAGEKIGTYLDDLGFNLDFAPVADVYDFSNESIIGRRSFSDNPYVVRDMAEKFSKGLEDSGIISVYKHFPGHGSTVGDPHRGYAYTNKTLDELWRCDLLPFKKGIENGVSMIMVGHISFPNILEDGTPASLSKEIITDILREEMEYDGIIVTDAMNMEAVSDKYESDEAALHAIEAGADIILMPKDFRKAYTGIISAVENGVITEDRIDESVKRILCLKIKMKQNKIK